MVPCESKVVEQVIYHGAEASRRSMPKQLLAIRENGDTHVYDALGYIKAPKRVVPLSNLRYRVADLDWSEVDLELPIIGKRLWAVRARGASADERVGTCVVTTLDVNHAARLYEWNSAWNPHVRKIELQSSPVVWRALTYEDLPKGVQKMVVR